MSRLLPHVPIKGQCNLNYLWCKPGKGQVICINKLENKSWALFEKQTENGGCGRGVDGI